MLDAYSYMRVNERHFRQGHSPGERDFREWREGEDVPEDKFYDEEAQAAKALSRHVITEKELREGPVLIRGWIPFPKRKGRGETGG